MNRDNLEQIILRSNERYDNILNLKQYYEQQMRTFNQRSIKQKQNLLSQYKKAEKGIMGKCLLRFLSIFYVGTSFLTDNLHNVYSGAFVS